MRILLIEDDQLLALGIITALKRMGYQLEHCTTGLHTKQALLNGEFALMILDLGLPDGSAVPLIKSIRKNGHNLPILVLTAQDQIEIKLAALNNGADDYLVKPTDVREIEARIRVLVRRSSERKDDILFVSSLRLDLQTHECEYNSQSITLTKREFLLLKEFMMNPNRILSRQYLDELSYGWEGEIDSNATEVHIHHLRKKLSNDLFRTVIGIGYMLVEEYDV